MPYRIISPLLIPLLFRQDIACFCIIPPSLLHSGLNSLGKLTTSFVFCDDAYLHSLNLKFLGHDYFTDILTFNYNVGSEVNGDICISVERVKENALEYDTSFERELARVLVHGVLHLCGHKDLTQAQKLDMRTKENFYLSSLFSQQIAVYLQKLFHVEH